jgi:TRAP-type C4-dicarboxylate transport system substrate-binding protein
MKKAFLIPLLVLISAALMITSCASPSTSTTPAKSSAPAPTQSASTTTAVPVQPITLKFTSSSAPTEGVSVASNYFMDNVEKKSGGRVKFERYYGAVLGKMTETIGLISSGSVDLGYFSISNYRDKLPLHSYMVWNLGGQDASVALQNKLMYEIPETKAILDKEDQDNNLKTLFIISVGNSGFAVKNLINSLSELKGKKIGAFPNYQALTEMGYNIISVDINAMYEALKNGVVDATALAFTAAVGLKWYEVASTWVSDGMYPSGAYVTMNLKTWSNLPKDIQTIFADEAKAAQAYRIEKDKEEFQNGIKLFQNARTLPDAEAKDLFMRQSTIMNNTMLDTATKLGKGEEAKVVLKYWNQIALGK